jgi:hypothetical protein
MSDEELVAKFRAFTDGLVTQATADQVIESVFQLEAVPDFSSVMRALVWSDQGAAA